MIDPPLPHLSRPKPVNIWMTVAGLGSGITCLYVVDLICGLSLRDVQAQFGSSNPSFGFFVTGIICFALFQFYDAGKDMITWFRQRKENAG